MRPTKKQNEQLRELLNCIQAQVPFRLPKPSVVRVLWNCYCSWGCETCWVSHRCSKCGAMFGPAVAKEIMEETR